MGKVASNKTQAKQEKMVMLIMSAKSKKTNAYTFKKSMVTKDEALKLLAKKH